MNGLEITIDGRWISQVAPYGDINMSTIWPGGSDQLSWTPGTPRGWRFKGGTIVKAWYGPVCVWSGTLNEPDPSQEDMAAQGLYRLADNYFALDGSGNATTVPNTAIDTAIAAGLPWTRPASVSSSAVLYDISGGPAKLSELLDAYATQNNESWGVTPQGAVYRKTAPTTPSFATMPLSGGLGYALDNFASTLRGRYFNGTSYATATVTNTTAQAQHGHVEAVVDLTPRGTLTLAQAQNILSSLLALTYANPSWTSDIELAYGELLSLGGTALALETATAGTLMRVPGGYDLTHRQNALLYTDVPIGRTQLAGGTLTLSPAKLVTDNLADILTAAVNKK